MSVGSESLWVRQYLEAFVVMGFGLPLGYLLQGHVVMLGYFQLYLESALYKGITESLCRRVGK
jgi:hypothetical protein